MSGVYLFLTDFPAPSFLSLGGKFSKEIQKSFVDGLYKNKCVRVGFTKQTKSVKRDKNCLLMVPERALRSVDRHTSDMSVKNKSQDLYNEMLGANR